MDALRAETTVRLEPLRRAAWIVLWAALALLAGCRSSQYATVRSVPKSPLVDRLKLTSWKGPRPSDRSELVLRRFDLLDLWEKNPPQALARLEQVIAAEPTPEKVYTFAELTYLEGKKLEVGEAEAALDMFESSVTYAYSYLFDPHFSRRMNAFDPQFRGACDLYNGALEGALRIVRQQGTLVPGQTHTIKTASRTCQVQVVTANGHWQPDDFERFEFVSDYEVRGLTNQHQTFGLGVPLIAVRKRHEGRDACERFYPPGLSFPVTAFLRVMPHRSDLGCNLNQEHSARLELYDPLSSTEVRIGASRIPLESDLTTPLAYFLNNGPKPGTLATLGLLRPDKQQDLTGLYMTQPYDPEKIPVLFVHGLWSDPTTWTDMFNDLRSSPEIRQRYQFWFYLYPTGQPFWLSAARMRQDLQNARRQVDPQGQEPMLDQMVLVGHSMGGLVSKMQIVDSGEQYWATVSREPFQLIKASPETRTNLEHTYFFHSTPAIRRIVTIGTPHRGSDFANKYTRFLGRKLILLPQMLVQSMEELHRENRGALADNSAVDISTSIDSLAPESPILPVLLQSPRPPGVRHHNIVGVIQEDEQPVPAGQGGDGVVAYTSAHLDNVDSEIVINADHLHVHRHPLAVLEVRRVLLEHLGDIPAPRRWPGPQTPPFRTTNFEQPTAANWPPTQFPAQPGPTPYGPPLPDQGLYGSPLPGQAGVEPMAAGPNTWDQPWPVKTGPWQSMPLRPATNPAEPPSAPAGPIDRLPNAAHTPGAAASSWPPFPAGPPVQTSPTYPLSPPIEAALDPRFAPQPARPQMP